MKRIFIFLALLIFTVPAYAQDYGKIEVRGSSNNGNQTTLDSGLFTKYFTSDVVQTQAITATASAFTAITVPSGSKALLIDVGTSKGLKLKGVTGDNGISLDSNCPILLPVSDDGATVGLQNLYSSNASVRAYFF